ncbi:MAG: hypothetical protein ACK515_17160 [bacterium]|jgi:hypothetical protein|nr:hypothetical protein [Betaproteobacteria bacterium]
MNRSFQSLAGALALASGLGLAQSSVAATINFDGFADFQNINGVDLGGVTVTNPSGVVEIYANGRFGVSNSSPGNAIGSFTGGATSINPMIFTFSAPTSFVTLFGGDEGGDIDSWSLTVYDAQVGGNVLGTTASGDFIGSPYIGLTLAAASILRAEAVWTGTSAGIGFDDLSFDQVTQIPLPAPALLLGAGLAGLIGMARRRKAG